MTELAPVINVLLSRDHGGARVYVARTSWCPPMLRAHLDENLEAVSTKPLDLDDLERHMWGGDAPYEKRGTKMGGAEISARGRSAVVLAVWLEGFLRIGRTRLGEMTTSSSGR